MSAIPAIYENGVFRPLEPVDLPEKCEVEVVPKTKTRHVTEIDFSTPRDMSGVYAVLSERYSGSDPLVSDRHNEMEDASWIAGVNQAWAEDWNDPREDIYTSNDGEPLDGPR